MKTLLVITIVLAGFALSPAQSQNQKIYKHPSLDFQFTATENWTKIDHPEDKMILEMVDPEEVIHVILWVTETVSSPEGYLVKMADMKGLQVTGNPINILVNGREGWVIKAEGKINDILSTVFIASIPMTGDKYVHHKNHIAQYIMQIWCPTDLLPQKVKEIGAIQKSVEIL